MKRLIPVLLLCATGCLSVFTGGCADLQASKPMTATIDSGAVTGQLYASVKLAAGATQSAVGPTAGVRVLETVADQATVKPLAWLFEPNRGVLCTSKVYQDIQIDAALADEGLNRYPFMSAVDQVHFVNRVGQFLLDVKRWKDGQKALR